MSDISTNNWYDVNKMLSKLGSFWYTQFSYNNRKVIKGLADVAAYFNILNTVNNVLANIKNNSDDIYAINYPVSVNIDDIDKLLTTGLEINLPIDISFIQGLNSYNIPCDKIDNKGDYIHAVYFNGKLNFEHTTKDILYSHFYDKISNKLQFIVNGKWEPGYNSKNSSIYSGILSVDNIACGTSEIEVANYIKGSNQSLKGFNNFINICLGSTYIKPIKTVSANPISSIEKDRVFNIKMKFSDSTCGYDKINLYTNVLPYENQDFMSKTFGPYYANHSYIIDPIVKMEYNSSEKKLSITINADALTHVYNRNEGGFDLTTQQSVVKRTVDFIQEHMLIGYKPDYEVKTWDSEKNKYGEILPLNQYLKLTE